MYTMNTMYDPNGSTVTLTMDTRDSGHGGQQSTPCPLDGFGSAVLKTCSLCDIHTWDMNAWQVSG